MIDVLLPLAVVVPIVAATLPLALGLRYDRVGWPIAAVGTTAVAGIAAAIAAEVVVNGPFDHALGGFLPPVGIELVADRLSVAVLLLVAAVSVATLAFARVAGPRGNPFYSAYLLLVGGLVGMVLTGDLFNLFVFLEITGLTTYALIASDRSGASAYASLKYLVVGTVGASLYLLGVGYVFLATGTLNMLDVQAQIVAQAGYGDPLVRASYAFIVTGLALKIAIFPVHSWQPDAYQRAPDSVTTVVAALVSTTSAYALIRVTYTVFTVDFLAANEGIATALLVVSTVSIVAGSALAAMQSNLKRMFAYSSVAQFGMIGAAVALANETALLGGIVHLIGHGIMKFGLFLGIGLLALGYGSRQMSDLASAARAAPYTSGAVAVLGLGLVGIPPSIGFLGKWYIGVGAVDAGLAGGGAVGIAVAAAIFVSTLFTLSYVARLIERFYFAGAGLPGDHGEIFGDRGDDDAATDGGDAAAVGGRNESPAKTADGLPAPVEGAPRSWLVPDRVPTAPLLALGLAVLATVALGFGGFALAEWFGPFLAEVFA
ncbi:NADH/Ubiquinone/plastoquinone (complex I) [Halorubrum californiense DSM 19288]|uniref:NADH/Ubiquinone/plastoquinone (Complex I) n=1 Tax=Halorubrum californiense DSM 19288 TaxID=1227465 RepID=M0DX33_9EURY|nr:MULTISPECIES: proton-conducting transporter membrane subunit [Halorubrum]ELZ40080.1 NADH/Ubiquinone/plastoquinone (complex I) [Halorubrum californiense DSM 19288]TKX73199.1 monovalent cation/H+ antiporter subunit D family protein [Halorubrum sp. GN11GM_10-3_MGM]